jgi:hypothetical protein
VDDPIELGEDSLQHHLTRLRPRDVADGDRDTLTGPGEIPERRTSNGPSQRILDRLEWLPDRSAVAGPDDGRAIGRHVDPESV